MPTDYNYWLMKKNQYKDNFERYPNIYYSIIFLTLVIPLLILERQLSESK